MDSNNVFCLSKLQEQTNPKLFLEQHKNLVKAYEGDYAKREAYIQFAKGNIWSEQELSDFRRQKKRAFRFQFQKDSQRAFLGAIVQNKYDVTFAPFEETDQGVSDPLKHRYLYDADKMEFWKKDRDLLSTAYATGVAYQRIDVEVEPGSKPEIFCLNENVLGVYWDTNSKDVGRREDADYVDIPKFISVETLEEIAGHDKDFDFEKLYKAVNEHIENFSKAADRAHENLETRNGYVRIIERFYKVRKKEHYAIENGKERKIDDKEVDQYKAQNPDVFVKRKAVEYLYFAVACPSLSTEKFLYNGPYHCDFRHCKTGKVQWPIIEMVSESLNGDTMGFLEGIIDAVKTINAILAHAFHSARHADSTGGSFKPDFFKNPKDAKEYENYGSDPTRRWALKPEAPPDTFGIIQRGGTLSKEHMDVLTASMEYLERALSTPPAIKGQMESATTSAKLNRDRIQQAFVQLQQVIENYSDFLKRRAEVILSLWVHYNDSFLEENIRINQKSSPDDPDFIVFNQLVEETDELGRLTGNLKKLNDITTAKYDVIIKPSMASPHMAEKTRDDLLGLLDVPAVQNDPLATAAIAFELIQLSDLPMDNKARLLKASSYLQNLKAQQQQAEQAQAALDQQGQALQNEQTQIQNQQMAMAPVGPPVPNDA